MPASFFSASPPNLSTIWQLAMTLRPWSISAADRIRRCREYAELVAEVVGVTPSLVFDSSKPDGTPRKLLDIGRLTRLGWKPRIGLREGLRQTYADFCSRLESRDSASPGPATRDSAQPDSANPDSDKSVTQCTS